MLSDKSDEKNSTLKIFFKVYVWYLSNSYSEYQSHLASELKPTLVDVWHRVDIPRLLEGPVELALQILQMQRV